MPMRKASIDMASLGPPKLTGLRQPMRKASVDMNVNATSNLESLSQPIHVEGVPLMGSSSRLGNYYRYMSSEGIEVGHSSSESSLDGDGCMIDLIRPKNMTREVVQNIDKQIQMNNEEENCEDEIIESSEDDHDVRSMPRRSKWDQHEVASKQRDYGYQEHHPTPRKHDNYCFQAANLDSEDSDHDASDCMINMVRSRSRSHQLELVVTATDRQQRKASINMCGSGSSMLDMIGHKAGQGSNWHLKQDRRTSLDMTGVDGAKRHIANGTAPKAQ